jgi:small neutral amino acid transporter SnatA (MarC family)
VIGAVFSLLVALDPVGIGRTWPKRLELAAVVAAVLTASVLLADPVLDLLDLSPEGFWIAAGIVLVIPAFARIGRGLTRDVAGPASVLVAMAIATREGTGEALIAVCITVVATLLALTFVIESRWVSAVERVIGAAMVVVAFDLIRDGVIAV